MTDSVFSPAALSGFIESARSAGSVEEIHGLCSSVCTSAGFDFFLYGAEFPVSFVRPQIVIISGYPHEWWTRYQDCGYFAIDPVAQHTTQRNTTPLIWNDIDFEIVPDSELARRFMGEAGDFGLTSGVSFPVHGQRGESAVFSLVSRDHHAQTGERIMRALPIGQLVAGYIHEAARRVFDDSNILLERTELTPRERECLLWAAEGKTTWGTAMILGISERTVVFHLQNAARKLNVENRAQAVARAVAQSYVTPQFR